MTGPTPVVASFRFDRFVPICEGASEAQRFLCPKDPFRTVGVLLSRRQCVALLEKRARTPPHRCKEDCAPSRDTSTLLRGVMFVRWRPLVLIFVPERVRRGRSPVRRRSHRDVVEHYDDLFDLDLSKEELVDLVEYLSTL